MKSILTSLLCLLTFSISAQALTQFSNLPTCYITTEGGADITSKEVYIPGAISIVSRDTTEKLSNEVIQIRGRGNSTWTSMPKKSYRIKFEKKRKLLGSPNEAKNWVLLANYADKTMIRNAVAFEISRFMGMAFTPYSRFVDVVLNGDYIGTYQVTDQVEVNPGRVDVEKQDSAMTTEPDISGGYLLEVDGFASGEQVWFKTANGMPVTVKYPDDEDINDQQLTYITQFTQSFENTLLSASFDDPAKGYRAMVDTTSLIDWYLASEYTANPDCFWSTNIYKFRNDQRFYFGPLWDYDIAFCNDTRMGNTIDKYMYQSAFDPKTWVKQYWCDGWFVRAINRRWSDLVKKGLLDHLNTYVDSLRLQLDASQKLNFTRWPVLSTRVYLEYSLFPTYIQGIYYLKDFLSEREKFLTANLPLAVPGEPERPAEPFVAGAFYYLIMNRQTSNVVDINGRSTAENTKLVMWNPLDGQLSQQWSILPVRDNIFRFVNRYSGLAIQANGHGNNMTQVKPDSAIPTQQWKIVPSTTSSAYFLESVQDGYTADNSGGSSANGTGFIEWDVKASGYDNQLWYLQKADVLETALDQSLGEVFTFMIYPNPVSETLYLSCSGLGNQPMSIELYSVQGTVVNRMQSRDKDVRIAVDNLPKGLYLLKVTAGGRSYVTKFLKQ